jgi:transcriptional regulator with XRE-family HTH domain
MLETERVKKGWSQRKLSSVSGVSQSYISKLENSNIIHSPTLKQIIALALALNIDPKSLAGNLIEKEMKYQNLL